MNVPTVLKPSPESDSLLALPISDSKERTPAPIRPLNCHLARTQTARADISANRRGPSIPALPDTYDPLTGPQTRDYRPINRTLHQANIRHTNAHVPRSSGDSKWIGCCTNLVCTSLGVVTIQAHVKVSESATITMGNQRGRLPSDLTHSPSAAIHQGTTSCRRNTSQIRRDAS